MTTKTTQTTKPTFVKRTMMCMGGLALLAGNPLSGCSADMGKDDLESLTREAVSVGNILSVGGSLYANQMLQSPNGVYRATMSNNGRFVVTGRGGAWLWSANVSYLPVPTGNWSVTLDANGNIAILDPEGVQKWQSNSYFRDPAQGGFLKLDDFGGLTLYAGTPDSPGEKRWFSKYQQYAVVAQKWRPVFNLHQDQMCEPLTFTESGAGNWSHADKCRTSYNPDFAVFANVTDHPDDRPNSYRITYSVAFGWQTGTTGVPAGIEIIGAHGGDAQYLVVDVVDGRLTSVWADMHKGHYARSARGGRGLTLYNNDTQVTAWIGKYYNSLKLVEDTTTACKAHGIDMNISMSPGLIVACSPACVAANDCGVLDTILNWGDWVGEEHENQPGKLVLTDHACAAKTDQEYVSADGFVYNTGQLKGLRNYIGCEGAGAKWADYGVTFRSKPQATKPYDLTGCNHGDAANGGDICNATHFGADALWLTSKTYKNLYIDPISAGSADVDYTAGSPFNDIFTIGSVPRSITMRSGNRVDQVSVVYESRIISHGGDGGNSQTLDGLASDPVVAVEVCDGEKDGRMRVGHVKFVTQSGRYMEGGNGYSQCKYLQPSGKRFYGFHGRSGGEIDVLGTIWGDL